MSNRFFKEKSKKLQSEFNELSKIQSLPRTEGIDGNGSIKEQFQSPHNEKELALDSDSFEISKQKAIIPHVKSQSEYNHIPSNEIINRLGSIFGENVKGTFESYRRAGKFFFRCEHNEGKEYSQLIESLLRTIIEKSMGKTTIHYIIRPNSASAVFR